MKLPSSSSRARAQTGVLLIECIVYIGLFALIVGLGLATFFFAGTTRRRCFMPPMTLNRRWRR